MARFLDEIADLIHKAHAEAWLNDLQRSGDTGVIVAHNWRTDPNVASEKVARVAEKLAAVWQPGQGPLVAADRAVEDECLCASETQRACNVRSLSRIIKYGTFENKILNYDGAFTGAVTEENVETFLADLDPGNLKGFVQGSRPIAWCTPTEELEMLPDPDSARTLLGLPWGRAEAGTPDDERFKEETIVEITYRPENVPETHLPTVLEAGSNPCFLPSAEGADRGQTMDLTTGKAAATEYVHRGFRADCLDAVHHRGRLSTNAPDDWMRKRLAEVRGK